MAYVTGAKYDVFVSFALADNHAGAPGEQGWVARFVTELSIALKTRLGGTPELRVFFSERDAQGGNFVLEGFADDARQSALMLSVLSRGYVEMRGDKKPFTLQELEAFVAAKGSERLFGAQILPYYDNDPGHDILRSKIATKFWYETDKGGPATLSPTTAEKTDRYRDLVGDLAEKMSLQLRTMRGGKTPLEQISRPVLGTVLLAQVTDDLENAREGVRRYLQQYGVRVLPDAGVDYPADAGQFESAFAADVARADVFVQLLSDRPGRRPDGFVGRQADLAAAAGKPAAQWRRADLPMAELTDAQRRLLESSTVLVDTLESFNASVVARLRALANPPKPVTVSAEALVFINADALDMGIARTLGETITKEGHISSLPLSSGCSQAVREDLEGNIVDCDALLLVYGQSTNAWVRSQLRLYNKVKRRRGAPVRVLAVYAGPPEPKAPVDMIVPEMMQIDALRLPEALALLRQ